MVGTQNTGLLPARRLIRGGGDRRRSPDTRTGERSGTHRRRSASGRRLVRHMVLILAMARGTLQRHPRTGQRRDQLLLSDRRPRDRPRHHLLLGSANDHGRIRIHRQTALQQRLLHRYRARRDRPQDVKAARQLSRSAGSDRHIRSRWRPRRHHALRACRQRHLLRQETLRDRPQLLQQDLERLPPCQRMGSR